jgi:FkbM family methyltransferase
MFAKRNDHEVEFRRIHTYLLQKGILRRNIIDLGAWIGDNSIPWGINNSGIVYAIDPSSENCRFIEKVCELNNLTNVKIIERAISHRNETLSTNYDLTHATFYPGSSCRNRVEAVTLDHLFESRALEDIGYIHLDVEGMEFKVLQGSTHLIDSCRPIITFEQHLEIEDYNVVLRYLTNKQYKVFLIDEVLPGCRPDCRNSIAFPNESFDASFIQELHSYLGKNLLLSRN